MSLPPPARPERDPALRLDRFATWLLIGIGVITVASTVSQYTNMQQALTDMYSQFTVIDPTLTFARYPDAEFARFIGLTMMTTDAGLLGFTIWWALRRMNANRRAFWVPVVGWLISTAVSAILLSLAFANDPTFYPTLIEWANRVAESGLPTVAPTP